jgi:hypothetical protein
MNVTAPVHARLRAPNWRAARPILAMQVYVQTHCQLPSGVIPQIHIERRLCLNLIAPIAPE